MGTVIFKRFNHLRVPLVGLAEGQNELAIDEARYVRDVHHLRDGDTFVAFDPEKALEGDATIVFVKRGVVRCEVCNVRRAECVPPANTWLLLGLSQWDRFEWALREATALGVTDIVPTVCSRSSSSLGRLDRCVDASGESRRMTRWRKTLVQGARQSGRGDIPKLHGVCALGESIALVPITVMRVCLWERATDPLGPLLRLTANGIALLIGPEGGFEFDEVESARRLGFEVRSMRESILRTETAVIAALGAWMLSRD